MMRAKKTMHVGEINGIEVFTVFNKPFFINEMLGAMRPGGISPRLFAEMVEKSRSYDLNTILTGVTRQVDISGFVPNLAGTCTTPQEVLELLVNYGHTQLVKISRLEPEIQDEIFAALKGAPVCSFRALHYLDDCQGEVVDQLHQVRQASHLAQAMREVMEAKTRELYRQPEHLISKLFDQVIGLGERMPLYRGEPTISYSPRVENDLVVEVWQYYFMPNLRRIHLAELPAGLMIGEAIEQITPDAYQRSRVGDERYNPRTPVGFIGLLGKVGGALPRLIAEQVKKNESIHQQVLHDQEVSGALFELFSH